MLRLTGVLFDKTASLAPPWLPELRLLPIDRRENKILQEWEALALRSVPDCPYQNSGSRYNAYWRTHIADYAGARSATDNDKNFFEAWANRGAWDSKVANSFKATDRSFWHQYRDPTRELDVLNNMYIYMVAVGLVPQPNQFGGQG